MAPNTFGYNYLVNFMVLSIKIQSYGLETQVKSWPDVVTPSKRL